MKGKDAVRPATDLRRFKLDLIGQTRRRVAAMNPDGRGEVEDVDLAIMLEESDRLDRRLRFWKGRLDALAPIRTR